MTTQSNTNPGQQDPKEKGSNHPGREVNNPERNDDNNGPSRPKDPDNDPDQTPTREIQDPPKADPVKKEAPEKQKPGF